MKKRVWIAAATVIAAAAVYGWARPATGPVAEDIATLAKKASARNTTQLSSRLIPEQDLPPDGTRSLFDHLIAQNDGLPYPFEKLVSAIQKLSPDDQAPLVLMIPDGRSLLKAQANYHQPRVLVAYDFQAPNNAVNLGLAPRGQLFLGFVEGASEIEVISYNEAAGRFEFQLVQDYRADGIPKLVYAQRAICTTCHQGGTPIFPERPWNETNGQPETAAKISEARNGQPYLGFPLSVPLSVPERFDELTDIGTFIHSTQRAWLDGCGSGGVECRRQMLKLALQYLHAPAEFSPASADAEKLRTLQSVNWPKEGIAVNEGDIKVRDPLGERKGIKGYFRTLFAPKIEVGAGAKNNEDLAAFDKLPKLPAALDPLTPRAPDRVLTARDLDGAFGLAALLTEPDFKSLEAAAGYKLDALLAAVDRADPSLYADAPFSRVKAMRLLLAALGAKLRPGYCCLDTTDMSPPLASGLPPVPITKGSVLEHFEHYCFACHRGNPAKRLNFMAGATEAEVLDNIRAKTAIRDALDWTRYQGTDKASTLMPPADSAQHARMAEALKRNPKLLEDMQAAVPGLFDF